MINIYIYIYIFGPEQAIQANPFASQSKLKPSLTRLPFVISPSHPKARRTPKYKSQKDLRPPFDHGLGDSAVPPATRGWASSSCFGSYASAPCVCSHAWGRWWSRMATHRRHARVKARGRKNGKKVQKVLGAKVPGAPT